MKKTFGIAIMILMAVGAVLAARSVVNRRREPSRNPIPLIDEQVKTEWISFLKNECRKTMPEPIEDFGRTKDTTPLYCNDAIENVASFATSTDGSEIALASVSPEVMLADVSVVGFYDTKSGTFSVITGTRGSVQNLAWSPDGGLVAGVIRTAEPTYLLVLDRAGRVLMNSLTEKKIIADSGYMVNRLYWEGRVLKIVTQFAPAAYVETRPNWQWTERGGLEKIPLQP